MVWLQETTVTTRDLFFLNRIFWPGFFARFQRNIPKVFGLGGPMGWRKKNLKKPCDFHIFDFHYWYNSSWWLNQPIWKIWSSKWVHLSQIGVKIKNIWNHHPEFQCILWLEVCFKTYRNLIVLVITVIAFEHSLETCSKKRLPSRPVPPLFFDDLCCSLCYIHWSLLLLLPRRFQNLGSNDIRQGCRVVQSFQHFHLNDSDAFWSF